MQQHATGSLPPRLVQPLTLVQWAPLVALYSCTSAHVSFGFVAGTFEGQPELRVHELPQLSRQLSVKSEATNLASSAAGISPSSRLLDRSSALQQAWAMAHGSHVIGHGSWVMGQGTVCVCVGNDKSDNTHRSALRGLHTQG